MKPVNDKRNKPFIIGTIIAFYVCQILNLRAHLDLWNRYQSLSQEFFEYRQEVTEFLQEEAEFLQDQSQMVKKMLMILESFPEH